MRTRPWNLVSSRRILPCSLSQRFILKFSSRKRDRAVIAASRLAHSFAKKNFKKNLWDQGTVVLFVQGRQSNAQSCCFSYLTYCILDRVPLPSLFRKVPNSSSSCESSKCSLSSHKLQCHVGKKYHVTLSRASYSELNRSGGCRPSGKERFSALRASFWSKNKRGRGPLGWGILWAFRVTWPCAGEGKNRKYARPVTDGNFRHSSITVRRPFI